MYRPNKLEEDFRNHEAQEILGAKGYPVGNVDQCVVELVRRLNESETFPHEIGLFLGYPPKDVAAFMENSSAGVKYVGIWKVGPMSILWTQKVESGPMSILWTQKVESLC